MDFFRDIVLSAASQSGGAPIAQYASWPSLIGAENLQNPDFASDVGWNEGAGFAIALGKGTATAATSTTTNDGLLSGSTIPGVAYRCGETVDTLSLGTVRNSVGGTLGALRSSTGTFSEDLVAVDDSGFGLIFAGASMQIDNPTVKSINLGVEADWAFTGGNAWNPAYRGGVLQLAATPGDTASLTGSALTAFDAAVSNSTACTVTITTDLNTDTFDGTLTITMKGGTPVNFVGDGATAEIAHTVTSGAGSGFVITGAAGNAVGIIIRIQITPA